MIIGTNLMLLNVTYIRPDKRSNIEEAFEVVYKDVDTGDVRLSYEPPLVDIYFTKPEFRNHKHNKAQERIEKLEKVTCKFSEIKFEIAKQIGDSGLTFVKECYQNRDFRALGKLYAWPFAYKCDFQAEHYYISDWAKKYPLPMNAKLTKAFLDIETDLIDHIVDMDNIAKSANAPINLISVLLDSEMTAYTFILEPKEPKKYNLTDAEYQKNLDLYHLQSEKHEWLINNQEEFIKSLNHDFDDTYGKIKYNLRIYKEEIELIADAFKLLNIKKPNFILTWNMRFDIPYLIHRIEYLGYDPKSIICNPDFKIQRCYFREDKRTFVMNKQFDYFYVSSYSMFICQMRLENYKTSLNFS